MQQTGPVRLDCPQRELRVEPDQRLEIFLPRLLKALERKGLSEAAVVFAWKSVLAGAKQPPIKTVEHYQIAWTACDTTSDILTTLDDGSEAAACFGSPRQKTFSRNTSSLRTHTTHAFSTFYSANSLLLPNLLPARCSAVIGGERSARSSH